MPDEGKSKVDEETVLYAIAQFMKKKRYSPSFREIADLCDMASPSTAHRYVKKLKEKGYLRYEQGKPRSIQILKK